MITFDPAMCADNVLCTHPNQYPYFEIDVVPGTNWEIEQRGEHEFYAYHWDGTCMMTYIEDEHGRDVMFISRDEALIAIQQVLSI